MSKKNIFFLLLLSSFLIIACSKDCKKCRGSKIESPIALAKLESITVNFSGDLYLYQDTFQFAAVYGQEVAINKINKEIEDGNWELAYSECLKCEDEIQVTLVVPSIKQVVLVGSGNIIADESFQQSHITIINKGSGTITFKQLYVDSLITSIEGTGNIRLSGSETKEIKASVTGAGDLELFQLPGRSIFADITGSGNIFTTAIQNISATISGSGNIYYKGAPVVEENITGSGKLIKQQ
ncbi:MAG TPA: DUF2807 domain-containing protein [Chitinophagales bacterium]|nr:DUF2807 domain-containing protein [Chitinophagales bacterium]